MKITFGLLALSSLGALAQSPASGGMTAGEITRLQANSPLAALQHQQAREQQEKKSGGEETTVARSGGQSLIKQSDILHDGSNWTIVPKGAVLHVPAQLSPRVGAKPLGTLLAWSDFLIANRGWIQTEEVSFEQAAGKHPLPEARLAFWPTQSKVIVAVHQGGPISVRKIQAEQDAVTRK